jgi:alpha,alpha-trehalose phosphorylase
MISREISTPPEHVYPPDSWRLVERRFYPRFLAETETFFSTSNGYLGIRGTFEEGRPIYESGTFVNGFYESWPIVYGEEAYGFARHGQTIVNVTDASVIRLYVDDEPFFLPTANLLHFERALDMRQGTLDREILWETPAGKRVAIRSSRLVSFAHRHVAAIRYEVTVENASAPVVISSDVSYEHRADDESSGDPRRAQGFRGRPLDARVHRARDGRILLGHQTHHSGMSLSCAVEHAIETACQLTSETTCEPDRSRLVLSAAAEPGLPIRLVKYIAYHTSRSAPAEELCERSERTLQRVAAAGFERLRTEQREFLDAFWERSDVQLVPDPDAGEARSAAYLDQAIRFNLFHVLQASGRAEGVGVAAKGLTGEGYEGHYFWDTEVYVLPFLTYTSPHIARNLLRFRFSFLDKARERAREVNQRGALFPWRTINGDEASAYYAAGTAQYHINADIAYALRKYTLATGDEEFLAQHGAEVLVETARLWRDLGFYAEENGGLFSLAGVTGPDEYNTVVNNNVYTNLMARENLWYAAETIRRLQEERPEHFAALVHHTNLAPEEVEAWQEAADRMFLPYDDKRGIHLQDDEFLEKKPWDFDNTPRDKYPLLLHYHPLVIYRHQVVKQADVVLAMFLLGDEFTPEQKKRNFDFYDPLTTGDSSLSACIQSILASEIGYPGKALEYARYAALMDLADVGGNVKDGCHIASMGGTWMVIVNGFAGFRDYDGQFSFRPRPPRQMKRIRFPLTLRGQRVAVDITHKEATYTLLEGTGISIWHEDRQVDLSPQRPTRSLPLSPPASS